MSKELIRHGVAESILAVSVPDEDTKLERITKKDLTNSWGDISPERIGHVMEQYQNAVALQPNPTFVAPIEPDEQEGIAAEAQALRELEALVASRKEFLKARTFATVDRNNQTNQEVLEGTLPVEATSGKVRIATENGSVELSRGGGGRQDASIDYNALESVLEPQAFKELVCEKIHHPRQIIKAYDEYTPSEAVLEKSIEAGKVSIEDIRKAIVPGKVKPVRFSMNIKK